MAPAYHARPRKQIVRVLYFFFPILYWLVQLAFGLYVLPGSIAATAEFVPALYVVALFAVP
ncbi:hypothetical protein D3C83_234630 [compost metagenome]